MGYFDGLTDAIFKKDAEGRTLFYPWGILGKGYILETDENRDRIRRTIKTSYKIMFAALFVVIVFNAATKHEFAFITFAIFLISYLAWYIVLIKRTTLGLVPASEKLTIAESYSNSAKSHSYAMLIFLEVISLLFIAMSISSIFSGELLLGLLGTCIFGAAALALGYMIKRKREQH